MCSRRRGGTFQWVARFIIIGLIVASMIQAFGPLTRVCTDRSLIDAGLCSFEGFLTIIAEFLGFIVLWFLASLFYRRFLKRFLFRRFPISCGHRKHIFTGKSSKTLSELLLTIDNNLPTEEASQREENAILLFLDDVRIAFQAIDITPAVSPESIFVGSLTERYGIPHNNDRFNYQRANIPSYVSGLKTDIDVMICFEGMASFSGLEGDILIEPIRLPLIELLSSSFIELASSSLVYAQLKFMRSGDVLSSKDMMEQAKRAINCTQVTNFPGVARRNCCNGRCEWFGGLKYGITGPAINVSILNIIDCDITPCIKCCEWPPDSDWLTRQRCWPSQDEVVRILSHGCHLVAKPAPFDEEKTSWRLSFSVAEVELSRLVPNTARKCLLALKIILKDHLQPFASISSYQLKTVFLNTLEKTPVGFWVDDNIEDCFFLLLNEFHDALLTGECPHFWFKSVNLFGKFIDPKMTVVLIKKLEMIAENPAPFIFDDGCCCLYPCCTRERLYDFRGRRLSADVRPEFEDAITYVEHVNEHVGDRNNVEQTIHPETEESNPVRVYQSRQPNSQLNSANC